MRRPTSRLIRDKRSNMIFKPSITIYTPQRKRPAGTPQMPFTKPDSPLLKVLAANFISSLKSLIKPSGLINIEKAMGVFEKSLQQRIILEKLGVQKGVEVMTIHKSKGREFEGVVLAMKITTRPSGAHLTIWRMTI